MKRDPSMIGGGLVAPGEASLLKALGRVVACQNCSSSVFRSFGSVLVEVLGETGPISQFILSVPIECPSCRSPIVENTLVRCDGELHEGAPATPPVYEERPSDETNVVLIDEATLLKAQAFVTGCGNCTAHAEMTFDYILDAVTDDDPTVTEYVQCRPAECPRCGQEISEKTLIAADY